MNLTVLENRLADFNNTMRSIADNLQYFREIVEKELAEKEARKTELDTYKKRDIARNYIVHKGDMFIVYDDFVVPGTAEDSNTVKEGERLTVDKVDCLSIRYDVDISLFRNDIGKTIVLTLDQIRKMVENDILAIVGKNA